MDFPKKIQGTDGVRGMVCPSEHPLVSEFTPVEALLKKGLLTDRFIELYSFCYIKLLEQKGAYQPGQEIIVGWDPRDTQGIYYQAAIRGVRKAGAKAVSIGILPTPAIPLYLLYKEAAGGIMITASHNPPDQNGIKLFSKILGLKPLPRDDQELSSLIYQTSYHRLSSCSLQGGYEEAHDEALDLWYQFFELSSNTWLEDKTLLQHLILVIDPTYGCLKGLASTVFDKLGVNKVIEVSNDPWGQVNVNSGVADLEGVREIDSQLLADSGNSFQNSNAIQTMFELGKRYRKDIIRGNLWVAGAVFDADGDRFYRLDYDPLRDKVLILSGDEIAYHQARYLISRFPTQLSGTPYVNTVESDLNVSLAAAELGYCPIIEAVGDKWLLVRAVLSWLEAELSVKGRNYLKELKERGVSTVNEIGEFVAEVESSFSPRLDMIDQGFRVIKGHSIGSEASGHTITPAFLTNQRGITHPVFIGNGLKSAVNTFVSTECLYRTTDIAKYLDLLYNPFPKGFQQTLYVYYTDKAKLYSNSPLWHQLETAIRGPSTDQWEKRIYPQEPDMLYLSLITAQGKQQGAIFIRNSGTEDKTGINLRGIKEEQKKLMRLGEIVLKLLFQNIKNRDHIYAQAEEQILKQLAERTSCPKETLIPTVPGVKAERLLNELGKQGLIEYKEGQVCLTPLGIWYVQKILNPETRTNRIAN
jgi:phosphomannomutase